ncbi:MAG TPA: S16 family serine protease [Candidatus Thermoplasmatota archaeon]|nr:S16 family serine protease [Candidatus Thermoplasmatota archaeon]
MKHKIILILIGVFLLSTPVMPMSVGIPAGVISEGNISFDYRNVTVYAPAVSQLDTGYVGVISTITVTVQGNGSGRVFVDTLPLTDVDMQGSARLAVKVATALVNMDTRPHLDPLTCDYFFVVRTASPMIGGPSAGAMMTVAVISLLENWTLDNTTVMTGMINPDGSIGPIGGIPYKIDAAHSVGATRFLIPKGQTTYTEMITEYQNINGIIWQNTYPVTRNVTEYAQTNYGMEVFEVEDINDALLYFTGWTFPVKESPDKITTEDYITAMKPLATSLLDDARQSYQNASNLFNDTTIPNRYPNYYRNQVTDFLNTASDRLDESSHWYDEEVYYTSTSKSFQSLIDSHFVTHICRYFTSERQEELVQSLINQTVRNYQNNTELAKNASIHGMVTLQCVGAAQQRISEAASYLSEANTSFLNADYFTALYNIAYAQERIESVQWWLNISTPFHDSGEINETMITSLAEEYLDDAQQAIIYSEIILDEMGKTSDYLNDAKDLLETARSEQEKGYSAAALFGSFETLVKANLALELVDGVTDDKVERARGQASVSITESRTIGIEPVLAVSYYEYGQSLANESSLDTAIVYYKYADLIAGALRFTAPYGAESSRYVGVPDKNPVVTWNFGLNRYIGLFLLFALIGGIAGLGFGILLAGLFGPKKQKEQLFPKDNVPRSIEDYYKKQK